MANDKYRIGSGKTRLEKYARAIILNPVANAICIWSDLIDSFYFDILNSK
ncbi:hypothetical protein H8E88_12440 [candidate division KSB1 bacterium]|nr:hypothetical protein [candidate division KSB1 bacterium]